MDRETNGPLRLFVETVLKPALPEQTPLLTSEESISLYFRQAFINKSYQQWKEDTTWIYQPLEKIGKKVFDASFQLWLHGIIGNEPVLLQAYSDIEQRFTGEEYLGELSDLLKFTENVTIDDSQQTNLADSVKMTIFHSFVGAIVMSGDKYVARDFGFVLAKKWVQFVLNVYLKDRIDVKNTAQYTNKVMAVSGIWLFKNWEEPIYREVINSDAARKMGVMGFAAVDFVAPNIPYFPERFRGKLIGSGVGRNLTEAKLKASEMGLETLGINFVELKNSDVQFDSDDVRVPNSRIKQLLSFDPKLFSELMAFLKKNRHLYQKLSIRYLRIQDRYSAQIRKQDEANEWKNTSRGEGADRNSALTAAITNLIRK